LVGDQDLHNAVALNSTSFNAARMIGPAVSGVVIAAIGTGWAFLINGVSFIAVLISLAFLRVRELHLNPTAHRASGSFAEGFRYENGGGLSSLPRPFVPAEVFSGVRSPRPIYLRKVGLTKKKGRRSE